jgi:hypothetical protein
MAMIRWRSEVLELDGVGVVRPGEGEAVYGRASMSSVFRKYV